MIKRGFDTATGFLNAIQQSLPNAILVCTWGDQGAWARDQQGLNHHAPAYVPFEVEDTIGAGDTFNAGPIHAIATGQPLATALKHACQLAGKKVGQSGIRNLIS